VLTKISQDTAYRDILDLLERGALRKDSGGGRSASYSLATGVENKCRIIPNCRAGLTGVEIDRADSASKIYCFLMPPLR